MLSHRLKRWWRQAQQGLPIFAADGRGLDIIQHWCLLDRKGGRDREVPHTKVPVATGGAALGAEGRGFAGTCYGRVS